MNTQVMNSKHRLTAASLQHGQAAARSELEEARAEHARCAYAHAVDRNDDKARQALIQSKQRLDLLNAEIEGLDAAKREALRREAQAVVETAVGAVEQEREDALTAVDSALLAFERTKRAVVEFGDAWAALVQAEQESNRREGKITLAAGIGYMPNMQCKYLIETLLWSAAQEQFMPRALQSAQTVDDAMSQNAERARRQIGNCTDRTLVQLRDQLGKSKDCRDAD